jgi:hypothetical protein
MAERVPRGQGKRRLLFRDRFVRPGTIERNVMLHDLSIMVAGLCVFALLAILVPDNFAMPVDDDGNI